MSSKENLPEHICIIMDGNRRWAKQKNMPIKLGHKQRWRYTRKNSKICE